MKTLYFFIIILFISCRSIVKFNPEEIEKQIVVNSIMYPDRYLTVFLSKTANVLEITPELIENATVELWSNDNFIEKLTMDSAGYYSTKVYKTLPLTEYTLKINVEGFEEISATDYIPAIQEFVVTKFEESSFSTDYSDDFYDLTIKLINTNLEGLYFQLFSPYSLIRTSYFDTLAVNADIYSNDTLLLNSYYSWGDYIFKTSYTLNNPLQITLQINTHFILDPYVFKNYCSLIVLNSISENFYKYLKSYAIWQENYYPDDGMMNDYYLYSNIENGLGIFAGCNLSIDTLIWNNEIVVNLDSI